MDAPSICNELIKISQVQLRKDTALIQQYGYLRDEYGGVGLTYAGLSCHKYNYIGIPFKYYDQYYIGNNSTRSYLQLPFRSHTPHENP